MKDQPQPIIGVDIGKTELYVSWPDPPDGSPKLWPTRSIALTEPDWWRKLIALVAPGALVAAEPTGWHYLAPVADILTKERAAQIWLVNNVATGRVRGQFSATKSDKMDARALAFIAYQVDTGEIPRGVRLHSQALETHVNILRGQLNHRRRLVNDKKRLTNQLQTFAHSLWPLFDQKLATWLRCVDAGAITPAQVKRFAATSDIDGRRLRYVKELAADLPDTDGNAYAAENIADLRQRQNQILKEIEQIEVAIGHRIVEPPFTEVTRRLSTVPSASPIAIAAIHVATHGRADQLDPNQFAAAVGAVPRTYESGATDKTRLIKKGYRPAVNAVYMWTVRLLSPKIPPNPVREYHKRDDSPGRIYKSRNKLARTLSGVCRSPAGYRYQPPGKVNEPAAD